MNNSLADSLAGDLIRQAAAPLYVNALPRLRQYVPDAPEGDALWDAPPEMMEQLWQAAMLLRENNLAALLLSEMPSEES